jgi:hypothetical protein
MSEAYDVRDRETAEKPFDQLDDLEAKLKEIDALYAVNPTQILLNARFVVLAEMMKLRNKPLRIDVDTV